MKGPLTDQMNKARGKRLKLIAELYNVKNLTQQQIADRLGLSRQRVGKILKDAGLRS